MDRNRQAHLTGINKPMSFFQEAGGQQDHASACEAIDDDSQSWKDVRPLDRKHASATCQVGGDEGAVPKRVSATSKDLRSPARHHAENRGSCEGLLRPRSADRFHDRCV